MAKPDKKRPTDAEGDTAPASPGSDSSPLAALEKAFDGAKTGTLTPPAFTPAQLDDLEKAEHAEAMADKAKEGAKTNATPPAKPALVHLPASPTAGTRRYRVWPHGDLQRDGVTYAAGAEIALTEAVAATIPCLVLAE